MSGLVHSINRFSETATSGCVLNNYQITDKLTKSYDDDETLVSSSSDETITLIDDQSHLKLNFQNHCYKKREYSFKIKAFINDLEMGSSDQITVISKNMFQFSQN